MTSPTDIAAELAGARPIAVKSLAGGRNNQVYKVEFDDRPPLILKAYFTDDRDQRDRLGAEWAFLSLAESRRIATTPRPIARDLGRKCALLSFTSGRKLAAEEVAWDHVAQATDFIIALNAGAPMASTFAPASEACFSLAQHVATIDRRVLRLQNHQPDGPSAADFARFVTRDLTPSWNAIRSELSSDFARAGWNLDVELALDQQWISPSDFGFHNALCDADGRLGFLDFEYAGRDDPAKLICDFFCQPDIPVPGQFLSPMLSRLRAAGVCDAALPLRVTSLMKAYRIKWICILLNEFLSEGLARRQFSNDATAEHSRATQLSKAKSAMTIVQTSFPHP